MTVKRFSLALAVTLLCALFSLAQAQTPRMTTVNITPDADKVHISAIGDVSEMRIEVSAEQGDVVFQSGAITGDALDWNASIPIQTWNYKSQPTSVRHIGAMAQDFRAAFGFGENDTTLNTVDTNGVTMAAIQGLYQMIQEKEQRNLKLTREVEELRARLTQLERTMNERAAEKR